MKLVDITESIVTTIEEVIFKKWKHEGFINQCNSDLINVEIDGREYKISVKELTEIERERHIDYP
jgi:hypothetical protein